MGKGKHGGHGGFHGGHGGFHGGHGGFHGGHGGFHRGHGFHGGHGGFYRRPAPGLRMGMALGVGMAVRSERRAMRRAYRHGGWGRPVVVVQAPPPPPHVLQSVSVTHFSESNDSTTLYHVNVLSITGVRWEIAARYSSFEALHQRTSYFRTRGFRSPFPGKKPLKSFFGGLNDAAKDERRTMLGEYLSELVALSELQPGIRGELNNFLRTPSELCRAGPSDTAPVATAQQVTVPASAVNTVRVQMPSGVQPGEMLSIEHHGIQYTVPAPNDVQPGAEFEVTLPEEEESFANTMAVQQAVPVDSSSTVVGTVVAIPDPESAASCSKSANPF